MEHQKIEIHQKLQKVDFFQQSQLMVFLAEPPKPAVLEALMTAPLAWAAFQLQPFPQIHLLLAGSQVGFTWEFSGYLKFFPPAR